jgi:exodeoxyribonuclease X
VTAYIFDTETTDRQDGEVIEAGFIQIAAADDLFAALGDPGDAIPRPLAIEDSYCERFKPQRPVTTGSMAVHHILPYELADCRPSADFALPADCAYIIGHSVDFDWQAIGSPANVKRICTHAIAQHVWPDATGYSLVALTYMTKGATDETRERVRRAHSAADDCQLAFELLEEILALRPEIRTWSALHAFSEECRIPRTCPMKKYEGVPLEDLDGGFVQWCLDQSWLDPYYRIGLERVVEKREAEWRERLARTRQPVAPAVSVQPNGDANGPDDIPF